MPTGHALFSVMNDELFSTSRTIKKIRTSNKSRGLMPRKLYIVIHYTVGEDFEAMARLLSRKGSGVSAHIVLGQEGEVAQIGKFRDKLWHAGQSSWDGRSRLNNFSIGIEVCNTGFLNESDGNGKWRQKTKHKGKWVYSRWYGPDEYNIGTHPNPKVAAWLGRCAWARFTHQQMHNLDGIIAALQEEYDIIEVIGHDMCSPGRKQDPGHCFDRKKFEVWNNRVIRNKDVVVKDLKEVGELPDYIEAPFRSDMKKLTNVHTGPYGGVKWRMTSRGMEVDGEYPRTRGEPATIQRIWDQYGAMMTEAADAARIPVELLMMTAAVETGGRAHLVREEPGFVSDTKTPNRVSPGLMQTLISTAQWLMHNKKIDRKYLLDPQNSIEVAAAYFAKQQSKTNLDPPLCAAGYNAGSIRKDMGKRNRWKMLVHPKGTGKYLDATAEWFNDCFEVFRRSNHVPSMSYYATLNRHPSKVIKPEEPEKPKGKGLLERIVAAIIGAFKRRA